MSIDHNPPSGAAAGNPNAPAPRFISPDSIAGFLSYAVSQPAVSQRLAGTNTRHIGRETQRSVLAALAVHADSRGVTKISQQRLADDLLLDRRDIRNCLTELAQIGLIRLVQAGGKRAANQFLVLPDLVAELTQTPRVIGGDIGGDIGGGLGGDTRHKEEEQEQIPPRKNATRQPGRLSRAGREIMNKLLDTADYSGAANRRAVRAKKEREYLPTVLAWEQQQPPGDPVAWCVKELRRDGHQFPPVTTLHALPPHTDQPNSCAHGCNGRGEYLVKNDDREVGYRNCLCNGGQTALVKQPSPARLHAV